MLGPSSQIPRGELTARLPNVEPVVATPDALQAIAARTTARLDALFEIERGRWTAVHADLDEAIGALQHMVTTAGKRLRPAFCYWAHVGAGGDPDDPRILDLSAGLELLHAFALAHDDVMDAAATRRGEPTIHVAFADRHRSAGWRGSSERFGEAAAILLGDLGHVLADTLVTELDPATRQLWNELRIEVNIGQYLDVLGAAQRNTDLDLAMTIVRYKSARYSVERPLQLGASVAGRPDTGEALARFGAPLGEAFQLRDDVLGVFGDASVTGKPVGDDLREGKPTPLLAMAHARASDVQCRVLGLVGRPLDDDQVAEIQQVIVDTGARRTVEERIDTALADALVALNDVDLIGEARAALTALAHFVIARSH